MAERRSLLRSRDFSLILGAIGLSAFGDFMAIIALGLLVQQLTDSGIAFAALLIALWSPLVLLAAHAGLIADRFEATRTIAVVSAIQAVVAAGLIFADTLTPILILSLLLGIGFAISQPAEFALVPAITGEDRLAEANGLVETTRNGGIILGPIVAGILSGTGDADIALGINAASFVVVTVAALLLRTKRRAAPVQEGETDRARDGIVFLYRDRLLGLGMSIAFISLLFMSASIPADIFFVKDTLGVADPGYGIMFSIWAVGMVLAGVVLAKRVPPGALLTAAFIGVLFQGLGKFLPPLWLVYPFMLGCYFVGGVAHGLKNVMFRTLIHTRTPERLRGRAFAAYNGLRNGAELGALAAGGILVSSIGQRATLLIAGGVCALAGLAGLALRSRVPPEPQAGEPEHQRITEEPATW